ncbi:TOBE domain-containing protein [Haloprofundus salinisoli]|uniref:TOBE domain-containing protein n=1 Tax=Haloprofundus salinisoli TaxID=2876193 RepID=UPI001CC9E080|nr:TOBE domain-containing protein [Haloprofundus salinisoli]
MTLSARNRLSGTIESLEIGESTAEVQLELNDGQTVAAVITANSAERLDLTEGESVDAVVKATDVMIDA